MKNLKKLLALVVACVMVFGMVASAAVIEFPDVASNAKYAEAVKVLSGLNIINGDDKGNFNPDQNITRAEMAKVLCAMMVKDATFAQTESGFADVTAAHWASGYVKYAKGLGYINGYDATTYGPEDNVTYEQAIKLIVAATGWGLAADANGGYPSGYMMIAADKDITKNVVITDASAPAKRSDIAIMAFNALTVDMMKREVYGTVAEYKKSGETLLGSKLGAWKYTGRITNSYVINPDDYKAADGEVRFDGPTVFNYDAQGNVIGSYQPADGKFICTDPTAADYLGYKNVTAYFVENADGDDVIVAVTTKASRVTEYVFDDMALLANAGDNLQDDTAAGGRGEGNDMNFAEGRFAYWTTADHDDKRPTILKVDNTSVLVTPAIPDDPATTTIDESRPAVYAWDGAVWYVNDVLNSTFYTALGNYSAIPAIGTIKAYDTDGDDKIDLFKTTEYDVAVVDSVNANTQRIRFKSDSVDAVNTFGATIALNEDKFEFLKDIKVTIDGEAAEIADLQENDVVYMYGNNGYGADMTEFEIIASRKAIEGKAMSNIDAQTNAVTIGAEDYKVFNAGSSFTVALSDEGKYFLTPDGEIAGKDANPVRSQKYAYIHSVGADSFGGVKVRMFTAEGEDVTYDLAEKITINDKAPTAKSAKAAFGTTELTAIFGATAPATIFDVTGEYKTAGMKSTATTDDSDVTAEDIIRAIGADALEIGNDRENRLVAYDVSGNAITKLYLNSDSNYGAETQANLTWKNGLLVNSSFEGRILASGAKIFMIPAGSTDITEWKVVDASALVADRIYPMALYGLDTNAAEFGVALADVSTGNYDKAAAFAYFKKAVATEYEEEDAWKVIFLQGGEEKEMYIKDGAAADVYVDGVATTTDLVLGEAFLYEVGEDTNTIAAISPVMAPIVAVDVDTDKMDDTKEAIIAAGKLGSATACDVDAGLAAFMLGNNDFMHVNNTTSNADNVVEFGIIGEVKSVEGGLQVTLATDAGNIKSSNLKFVVGEDANITVLNYKKNNIDNRLKEGSLDSIQPSNCKTGANGFDFANISASEIAETYFQYALIRMYNDKVVDVLIINHESTDL